MPDQLQAIALAALVTLAAASAGARLERLFFIAQLGLAARISLAVGLGFTLLSLVMLLFGALGLLSPLALLALLAALISWGIVPLGKVTPRLLRATLRVTKANKVFSLLTALLLLLALVQTLAPPGVNDWDAISYHLAVPKLYAEAGQMHYVPFIKHASQPFALELVFTLPAVLGPLAAAQMLHWVFLLLTALLVYSLAQRAGKGGGMLAALLLVSAPVILWEATIAYIDLALVWATLASLVTLLAALEQPRPRLWVLTGLLVGAAIGFKLSSLMWLVIVCALLLLAGLKQRERIGVLVGRLAMVGLPALLIALPWFLRSWAWTGNPVYPFLYSIFGGANWSAEAAAHYRAEQLAFGLGHSPLQFIRLPFDLTFNAAAFFDSGSLLGEIGPLFLALTPLALLVKPLPSSLKWANLAALLLALGWFVSMQQIRYLLPSVAIWAATGGWAFVELWKRAPKVRWAIATALGIGLLANLPGLVLPSLVKLPVAVGLAEPEPWLTAGLQPYETLAWANRNLPQDAKVICYGEPRLLYLDRGYLWGEQEYQLLVDYSKLADAEALIEELHRQGYDYMLVNFSFMPKTGRLPALLEELVAKRELRLLTSQNRVSLFVLPGVGE